MFHLDTASPYMLLVAPVQEERRIELPNNYYDLPLWERLYYERSDVQSITHLDFRLGYKLFTRKRIQGIGN
jgi:carbamoyltransferase